MVAFLANVLELEKVRESRSSRGSHLVFFKAPGSEELIEVCHYPPSGPVEVPEDLMHLAFAVEDLDAFGAKAEAAGFPFSDGPHGGRGHGRIAFVDGPEGYEIELIEPGAL